MARPGLQPRGGTTRHTARRPTPRPIGPGSLLWHYAGDRRLAFTGLSAGILQLMHPAIGAGVAEHSNFFTDPWDRIIRSLPQILGVVYNPDPEATGRRVRDYHRPITGTDHRGRPYRALEPGTFWWAHATFQNAVEQVVDLYDSHRLTQPEREDLYLDGVEWYRRYHVAMRPVPADRQAFGREWRRYLLEVLEMTPAAQRALDMALHDRRTKIPFLPAWSEPLQPVVVAPLLRLTTIGGLPPEIRLRFGIPWRPDEELRYRLFRACVRQLWRRLPPAARYSPTATAGYRARVASAQGG